MLRGPGASADVLGIVWSRILGPFGFLLGLLGLLLEPLGRVRGASWSDLGASWRGLGASWDGLGTYVAAIRFLKQFKMDLK